MGNGQSVEAPRRPPNRLSKPRTNSSTNLLNLKPTGPPSRRNSELDNGSKRYSTMSINVVAVEQRENRERTQKKRRSIFRSQSAQPKSVPLHIDTGANVEFLERTPVDNWSVRGSLPTESPVQQYFAPPADSRPLARPGRMSLQHVPYPQQHARLSLVAEGPSPESDQWEVPRRISHMQTEQAEKRISQYSQHIQEEESPRAANCLPERTNSQPDLFAPIRRRSFLQHGIATRTSWVENDARLSLPSQLPPQPSQSDLHDYYYNPDKPTSSPLSNIAAMLPNFEDDSPGPRTVTPNDLDYGHIGAFKLGSLRITNGAVSPSTSFDMGRTGSRDDNFLDGQSSAHGHRASAPRSNTISAPQEIIKSPWVTRVETPLRQAHDAEWEPLTVNTHLPLPEFTSFYFNAESPTRSLDLARGYMRDLALSPFSFEDSPPRTPVLEATSKNTAMEDDLFEVEPSTPDMEDFRPQRSFDSGYRPEELPETKTAVKGPRNLAPRPLAKADSGYSSNVSLRSFKGSSKPTVPTKVAPPTPPKEPVSRVASSAYSVTSTYSEVSDSTIRTKRSLPVSSTEDVSQPLRQALPAPALPTLSPGQGLAAASTRPHVVVMPIQTRRQTMPAVPQSFKHEFTTSHSLPISTGSENSSTSKLRKDKNRSQSMQPKSMQSQPIYTVQAIRSASEELSFPPIPTHVSRHLEQRVDGFPISSFPNTVAKTTQLRTTASKETLGTIFSVGSVEYREAPTFARLQSALPPVPVEPTIPEISSPKPEVNRRHTFQPFIPAPATPVSSGRNRQSIQAVPRKATPIQRQSQQVFENHITSYESVSSSIGKSPYDIALGPVTIRPTTQERAKSMTSQLEAEARERFTRTRSVSQESFISTTQTIQKRNSSVSIGTQKTFSSSTSSFPGARREKPPPAHAKWSGLGTSPSPRPASVLVQQRWNPNLTDDGRQFSMLIKNRVKSPPPVTMQTQHKAIPTQTGAHVVAPPSRAAPLPPQEAPHFTPPVPPYYAPTQTQDQWADQRTFWAEQRESVRETLQRRQSGEIQRSGTSRASMESRLQLKSHCSWDTSQQSWAGYGSHTGQYDHTYDSYARETDKENWNAPYRPAHPMQKQSHPAPYRQQEEYYDGPSHEEYDLQEQHLPQVIHRRQNSTSEMLVLDRFTGGLGYGYEPGVGLGGSAGTRNRGSLAQGGRKSVEVSKKYGVDFSDVPVFLQRAKLQV